MTLDRLRAEMGRAAQLPGVSQHLDDADHQPDRHADHRHPIRSGREDLRHRSDDARDARAAAWRRRCGTVPGASNVYPEQVTSGQYLNIEVDRAAAARYGIGVGDVQQVDRNGDRRDGADDDHRGPRALPGPRALRGRSTARTRRRWPRCWSAAPGGAQIPLGELARIEHARGPAMISSENGLLLATVLLNVQGRDVGGFVQEARRGRRATRQPAGRLLHRLERALGEPGARARSGCRS